MFAFFPIPRPSQKPGVTRILGHAEDARRYLDRSAVWTKLWDPNLKCIRPRYADGRWLERGAAVLLPRIADLSAHCHEVGGGKTIVIDASETSDHNLYVQSAEWNGSPLLRAWLTHDQVAAGGRLVLHLGSNPSKWATDDRPPNGVDVERR